MNQRTHRWQSLWPILLLAGITAGCGSEADRVTGTWQGTLDLKQRIPQRITPGSTLRVVWHIQKNQDGTLTGSLDSPDQGATGIAIDSVTIKSGAIHLQSNPVFASFDGQLSGDGRQISGQWKQGPLSLPLTLTKGS